MLLARVPPGLLLLSLQFAKIVCLDCSDGYLINFGVTMTARCHLDGMVDWEARVNVNSDTLNIRYNCTGPNPETGVLRNNNRNRGSVESGSFQIEGWDYRTSICYLEGCYQEVLAGFPKYSIPSITCDVEVPSPVSVSSYLLPSPTTTVKALPQPSSTEKNSVMEIALSTSQQLASSSKATSQSTSHSSQSSAQSSQPSQLSHSPTVPSPVVSPSVEGKESSITQTIVAPSVSSFIVVVLLLVTCLAIFFMVLSSRRQKDIVHFQTWDEKHIQQVDNISISFHLKPSSSECTITEPLDNEKKSTDLELDTTGSKDVGAEQEDDDAHSECISLSEHSSQDSSVSIKACSMRIISSAETSGQLSEYMLKEPYSIDNASDLSAVLFDERQSNNEYDHQDCVFEPFREHTTDSLNNNIIAVHVHPGDEDRTGQNLQFELPLDESALLSEPVHHPWGQGRRAEDTSPFPLGPELCHVLDATGLSSCNTSSGYIMKTSYTPTLASDENIAM